MNFEQDATIEKIGEKVGFVFAYLMFTTILFFVLKFVHKIPLTWNYINIAEITLVVAITGLIVKWLLK